MTQEKNSASNIDYTARSVHRKQFEDDALPHLAALWNMAIWLTMRSTQAEELLMNTMSNAYRAWPIADTAGNKAQLFRLLFDEFSLVGKRREEPDRVLPAGRYIAADGGDGATLAPTALLKPQDGSRLLSIPDMFVRGVVARLKVQPRSILVLLLREAFSRSEITYITGSSQDSIRSSLTLLRRLIPRCIVDHSESSSLAAECCELSRGKPTTGGNGQAWGSP